MKKNLSLATILVWILTSFIFSCANMNRQNAEGIAAGGLARAPQSEQTVGEDLGLEDKLEKAFEAAMNPSLDSIEEYREPGLDEKIAIDRARSKSMSKYIKRQIGMFHIAQELVIGFDEQLDRVHRKLMEQRKVDSSFELSEVDKMPLLEARIKLNVAWEFSERNLHELQFIYMRLLRLANLQDDSQQPESHLRQAAIFILDSFHSSFRNPQKRTLGLPYPWLKI